MIRTNQTVSLMQKLRRVMLILQQTNSNNIDYRDHQSAPRTNLWKWRSPVICEDALPITITD